MIVLLNKLMTMLRHTGAIMFAVIACACTSLTSDIEVKSEPAPGIAFNKYNSYAWSDNAQIAFDPIGQWEQPTVDMDDEVRLAIDRQLKMRGIHHDEDEPDLLVSFAGGTGTSSLELKESADTEKPLLTNIPKSALVIILIDTDTGNPVFSGSAVGKVQQQQSLENIRQRIEYAVSEIFSAYNK